MLPREAERVRRGGGGLQSVLHRKEVGVLSVNFKGQNQDVAVPRMATSEGQILLPLPKNFAS